MSGFNLSEWALRHKSFVIYLMVVSAIAGFLPISSLAVRKIRRSRLRPWWSALCGPVPPPTKPCAM